MDALESYRVHSAPPSFFYVPDFVSVDEELYLLRQVDAAPRPRWQQLSGRRLQNWGGVPHPRGMVPDVMADWLRPPIERVARLGCFGSGSGTAPNHVLVNEYLPGQGIMPHTDGPLFHPVISTVSLGSHTLLDIYRRRRDTTEDCCRADDSALSADAGDSPDADVTPCLMGSLLLERRSLLVVQDGAYSDYLHGIAERSEDKVTKSIFNLSERHLVGEVLERGLRVSLTIRHVPKVLRMKLRL